MNTVALYDVELPKGAERRKFPRLPVDCLVEAEIVTGNRAGMEFRGRIINISKEGLQVTLPAHIAVGSQLCFVLRYGYEDSISVGVVVWASSGSTLAHYGIKILQWCTMDRSLSKQLDALETNP